RVPRPLPQTPPPRGEGAFSPFPPSEGGRGVRFFAILVHQAPAPPDRDLGHLSPVVAGHARAIVEGPAEPPAGARAAAPRRWRDRPRYRPFRQRPAQSEARRAERLRPGPAVSVQA